MNIIQLSTGSGKTLTAILQSIKYNYHLIVPDEECKVEVLKLCGSLRDSKYVSFPPLKDIPTIYTVEEVLHNKELLEGASGVVIDDLDIIIQRLLGIPSSCITITTR